MTTNIVRSSEEKPNIEWTKNDSKRNLEVFIGNPGISK